MFGGFASSCEANYASSSEAPSPSHSERAASAFNHGKRGNCPKSGRRFSLNASRPSFASSVV
ncbi:hypothetical protein COL30_07185 [Bacillus pseudomycoides]|uniref:Uncharacterized protein n=1 Tax=Bacillus pseudomycoides TaxID=64104 RepID=A0A2B4MNG1_9BACI|nr:hypothetical protein CON79_14770 [Bacillus pseudomycoides]PEA82109.1 hypothetical protein CON99_19165 [Bacillus pseudomycoides]PED07690.1 hypothetical protein COO19_14225 [Bacillus pseudomycoides]PED72562.1 hypothetical protein CON97_07745 [Bacillus pseudomycoides]PEI39663.1 hypothetical protein CN620_18405 [Bacillus pseudomycoides]